MAHAVCGINVALHVESKWNGIGFAYSSDLKSQKDFNLAMASRRAALSGNALLIAIFSSVTTILLIVIVTSSFFHNTVLGTCQVLAFEILRKSA